MGIRSAHQENVDKGNVRIPDVPDAPTIGTASDVGVSRAYNNAAASVAFTPVVTGGPGSTYTATSTPGGFTGSSSSSPITVTGLNSQTAYTFAVKGANVNNVSGTNSSASNSVTVTSIPQAPTIGTVSATNAQTVSIPFTAGATGGKSITSYTTTCSPSIALVTTGTTSPLTVTGSFNVNTAYTFQIAAVNANGTSIASSVSNSITPFTSAFESIATLNGDGTNIGVTFSNIPSTYTHLQIRVIARDTSAGTTASALSLRVGNGSVDSGSSYPRQSFYTNGTTTSAERFAANVAISTPNGPVINGSALANAHGAAIIDLYDYTSTTKNKSVRIFSGGNRGTAGAVIMTSGTWLNQSVIDTIYVYSSNPLATTTKIALYGIKA